VSAAINEVRYAFMDLRNILRAYRNRKNKQPILNQIDFTINSLLELKEEISR